MNEFNVTQDTKREPVGMKIVGTGVILSCLTLCALFAWGIYLNLTAKPCVCEEVESTEVLDSNGCVSGGKFIRKNAPAFSIKIPAGMRSEETENLYHGQHDKKGSLDLSIGDFQAGESFANWVEKEGQDWKAYAEDILNSPKVDIVHAKKIDMYGKYEAFELKIKWLWSDRKTKLTTHNHYILKGDKVIKLSTTQLFADPEKAYSLFKTINLDPF